MRKYTLKEAPGSSKRLNYEEELNEEQRAVVFAEPGATLVLAGAGSGKTRTLVYRVARLLETGYAPDALLLLTFTNRSAREMMRRAAELTQADVSGLWGGTFHHVGHRLLREHAEALGFTDDFGILDREDATELMQACVGANGASSGKRRFPKADVLVDLYSSAVNMQRPLVEMLAEKLPQFLPLEDGIVQVVRRYVERKRELNLMDFDDLLLSWKRLLVEHPQVGKTLGRRFRAVLVDEYQDVNQLQADIVDLMAAESGHVLVVGDDAQSIYGWRGADVESILRFPERWAGARVLRLTTNYRSVPGILSLANASIAQNTRQFRKELKAVRRGEAIPALVSVRDVNQQAAFVAQRLLELRDEGLGLSEMAVLYRAHHHAMELQLELGRRGIPFVVRSGVRFFEQAHVKDAMAFLRFVDNPRDELAFKRFVKLFSGVGLSTADSLWGALADVASVGTDPRIAFTSSAMDPFVPARARQSLQRARALVGELCAPSMQASPSLMLERLLDEGSLSEWFQARYPNAKAREEDISQLASYAMQFASVSDFVADISLAGELQGEDVVDGEERDERLTLSSIHQAKGLEWRAVFVLWAAEGRFPSPQSLRSLASEEEERRLFYVACTRAKDELYLLHPIFHAERDRTRVILRPSRFVSEVEARTGNEGGGPLFERWAVEEPPPSSAPELAGAADRRSLPKSNGE